MANYSKGKIAIPNVTGNIVINIAAVESAKPNLFVKSPSYTPTSTGTSVDEVAIGGRLASGGVVKYWKNGVLVTRFIEAHPGDRFKVRTDATGAGTYDWFCNGYSNEKSHLAQEGKSLWQFDEDEKGGIFTVPNNSTWVGTELIKLGIPYADIDNITIYKL